MIRHCRILLLMLLVVLPLSSCQCRDTVEYGWELTPPGGDVGEGWADGESPDGDGGADTLEAEDVSDVPEVADVTDVADGRREIDTWQDEEIMTVSCDPDLHNDRTSLVIDDNGTLWLGYHKYDDVDCSDSTLVVSRKRLVGRWVREDIQPHEGIFGLSIIDNNRPIVVYPDASSGEFMAAHRRGPRRWDLHRFEVGPYTTVTSRDGFDVTEDGERFFVTFAEEDAGEVLLFSYDTTRARPRWRTRRKMVVRDPQAAMGRGLRADSDDSVYLVHTNDHGRFGLARYDKNDNRWSEREYFDDANQNAYVHSFIIRDNFELCMSSRMSNQLLVTCGTMFDLQRDEKLFEGQIASNYPSSMIEGDDGTLYVVFHPQGNRELKVAKRSPSGVWSVQTVYDGLSYGISTAIDKTGDLVMAFYTCDQVDDQCSLKVLRERPDEL